MKKIQLYWFKFLSWVFWPRWEYLTHYSFANTLESGIKIVLKDPRSDQSKIVKVPGAIAPIFGSMIQKGYQTQFIASTGKVIRVSVNMNADERVNMQEAQEALQLIRQGGLAFDMEFEREPRV